MFTEAEINRMHRENAENKLIDLVDPKLEMPEDVFNEILEKAIEYAVDEYDAEIESDGNVNDCTNYEACAERAIEEYISDKIGMQEMADDDRAHAARDRNFE